jgi:hypothetical protein
MAIATRVTQVQRGLKVPGIYEAWIYAASSWGFAPTEMDRWAEGDPAYVDDAAYAEAWAEARDRAEEHAAERIAKGEGIVGKPLPAGHRFLTPWPRMLWPREPDSFMVPRVSFFSDPDRLYDIEASDVITVNLAATSAWKAKRAAEDAQRRAALPAQHNRHADLIEP